MEPLRQSEYIAMEEETQVAAARRAVVSAGDRLDLPPEDIARAEIVTAELATNILNHALRGNLLIGSTPSGDGLQIIALDKGPGIASVARAMQDGFTTSTTRGVGLGAVSRLTQQLDIFSQLGKGTVVSACISPAPRKAHSAVISVPLQGEVRNGDSWATACPAGRELFLVVDGLGHGLHASEASALAVALCTQSLERDPNLPIADLLQRLHTPMRATRGAAIAVASVDRARSVITYCGVGNISGVLANPDSTSQSLVSHNGTLGHQMRRVQEFQYPFKSGTLLILHSDGIATHWKMSQNPGLQACAPATIAGLLYRDNVRGHDDATILVARLEAPNA